MRATGLMSHHKHAATSRGFLKARQLQLDNCTHRAKDVDGGRQRSGLRGILVLLPALFSLMPIHVCAAPAAGDRVAPQAEDRLLIKPRIGVNRAELARFQSVNRCEIVRHFPGLGDLQVLRVSRGQAIRDLVRRYQASGLVEYAEPDYGIHLDSVLPSDPKFLDGTLWGLNNAGQNGGLANADIDAPEAWSALTSASNVIVAVIDSGVRLTHEDLAGNLWTNPLDGSHGLNAITGTTDINDDNGHGTRVAGVIGARGNNGLGVVGVAWQVRIMACKFTDQSGSATVADAITCLDYARTNGAHIINASWGLDEFSLSLSNAMAALRAAGILVVAAAGNSAQDIDLFPHYPASYDLDNIVAVMATTRQDEQYGLSNFGATNVDLAAPGDQIYSTDFQSDSSYAMDEGTSLAAAYVSGAAALLLAAHPGESPAQISSRLSAAVDPLPVLLGGCVSGGRLNLRKALGVPVSAPVLQTVSATPGDPFVLLLSGDPGRTYVVEASPNLGEWSPVATNLTGLSGALFVTNNPATNACQFYRALLRP
jgi:subtilisin family serine protease